MSIARTDALGHSQPAVFTRLATPIGTSASGEAGARRLHGDEKS